MVEGPVVTVRTTRLAGGDYRFVHTEGSDRRREGLDMSVNFCYERCLVLKSSPTDTGGVDSRGCSGVLLEVPGKTVISFTQ